MLLMFAVCFCGQLISSLLPFSFPGSVIAMFLLLILLGTGVVKTVHVEKFGDFLLQHMGFFLIPPLVTILNFTDILRGRILMSVLICAVSALLTLAATSLTVALVLRLKGGRHDA